MYQHVAIFCGSQMGMNPLFEKDARILGAGLARAGIQIIYGGGNAGLMGVIANSCIENNGYIIGVIPRILVDKEKAHPGLSKMHIVEDMHTRKQMMYQLSEAVIVLPGGNGTLDELFETVTWNSLEIHNKKIILLNTAGYYETLLRHMENMQNMGFLYRLDPWIVCQNAEDLLEFLTKD